MRRFLRGLAVAPFLGAGALAGQPPPPSSTAPPSGAVFRAEVASVEVDVLVTDARGEVVRGLTRDDFQVFEEGTRQEIAAFTEVAVGAGGEPHAAPLPRDVATNAEGHEGRIYAIVLDEAHTEAQRSALVRKVAGAFLLRHLAPGDVAAVIHAGGRSDAAQALTGDKRLLLASVSRFIGRKARSATVERTRAIDHQRNILLPVRDPVDADPIPRYGVDTDASDSARAHDARTSMAALEAVARSLQGVQGRRKAILFFSEGVDYDTFDVMGRVQRSASEVVWSMRNLVATAARSNVAVYTIDPRGLGGVSGDDMEMTAPPHDPSFGIDSQSLERERRRSEESLRMIAAQTGGAAVVDTNDFATAYERIVRASSHYYLLGYNPADSPADGAFRRIDVRVARPGLTVVARRGYVRPRADEEDRRPAPAAATGTSPELRELLHRPWPQPGLRLGVTAAAFRVTADVATVAVTVQVPGRELASAPGDDGAAGELEVSLIAVDHTGRVHAGDRVLVPPRWNAQAREVGARQGLRFVRRLELPPGRYQLRVAAREGRDGRRGSVFYDLHVPDYAGEALVMSGVLLTSRAAALTPTPAFDDILKGLLDSPPTVARVFAPEDVVTVYAEVYDALEPAHALALTTRVTSLDGREVLRATEERSSAEFQAAGGGVRHRVEIPLARVGPGTYLLRVEARPTAGGPTAARELSFDVLPNAPGAAPADIAEAPPAAAVQQWNVRPESRIDRLEAWLAAVERHEPGTPDGPALMVRAWAPADLLDLAADVTVVARLVDDPGYAVAWLVDPARPGRPRRSPYGSDDEQRLRAMARAATERCACARGRILKRGAVLHTDAAILFGDGAAPAGADRGPRPARLRVRFSDGEQRDTEGASGHWELAQLLLDGVAPDPGKDETVRLWYIAAAAYGQYHERHTRVEDRAAQLFPEDPDVLFLAGTLHETFASPRIQMLVRSLRLRVRAADAIGSEPAELRKAEALFRRALAAQPGRTEARLRLGRVLHRLGRHELAARELQRAVTELSAGDPTAADDGGALAYFAELFLGAAAEALGRRELARASYGRAAALHPGATSPRLALSRLALSGNDRAAALAAVRHALVPPPGGEERDDPWWRYHVLQGRRVDAWFDALRRSLTVEP